MGQNVGYLKSDRTKKGDECYTPDFAVFPLVKHLRSRGYNNVWCPFDKPESEFVRVLKAEGFQVRHTHIEDGFNFFDNSPEPLDQVIVSNPPFSCKDDVLERLYGFGLPFAMLLPQNSLQSKRRTSLFIKNGLEYLGFNKRIPFYTPDNMDKLPSGNHFASGYFCKDVLPSSLMFEEL